MPNDNISICPQFMFDTTEYSISSDYWGALESKGCNCLNSGSCNKDGFGNTNYSANCDVFSTQMGIPLSELFAINAPYPSLGFFINQGALTPGHS
jgi:hypothetical protein